MEPGRDASLAGSSRARRLRRLRGGGVILEVALAVPVLFMLSMGVVEYGYFIYVKSILQEAAQTGARVAIQSNATNATVSAAVATMMQAAGMQSIAYTVTTNPASVSTISTGTSTSVTVSASWGSFSIHPLPVAMGGISLSKQVVATATMVRE